MVPFAKERLKKAGSVSELVSTRGFESNAPNKYLTFGTWSGMSGERGSPPGQISIVIALAKNPI
jgi:hypothetical protein